MRIHEMSDPISGYIAAVRLCGQGLLIASLTHFVCVNAILQVRHWVPKRVFDKRLCR